MKIMENKKYHAFISYRHADNKVAGRQWATWLHQAIETYEVPADLVGTKNGRGEEIPTRIFPIFRDEEELPADADLGNAITRALDNSKLLIVLCSPRAVESTYVANEIDYFKKLGHSNQIIAAMIDGEPNASWDEGKLKAGFKVEDECFPIPLQFEYDENHAPTKNYAEPLAADFRINNNGIPKQGWTSLEAYRQHLKRSQKLGSKQIQKKVSSYQKQQHLMLLKIIAGILGVPLGELTQRDKAYRLDLANKKTRRLQKWLTAVLILALLAIGSGIFAFIKQQVAVKNEKIAIKAQAESELMLNEVRKNLNFMNLELRDVLNKYVPTTYRVKVTNKIDNLLDLLVEHGSTNGDNRSMAIALSNKVDVILASNEMDQTEALPFANEALEIVFDLFTQNPENIGYRNDLININNKLGDIFLRLGANTKAEKHYNSSLSLLNESIKNYPGNIIFKHSLSYSFESLAQVELNKGNKAEAQNLYQKSLDIRSELVMLAPENNEYKHQLSLSYINMADIQLNLGFFDKAKALYQKCSDLLLKVVNVDPDNVNVLRDLSVSYQRLAEIEIRQDNILMAQDLYQISLKNVKKLVLLDPNNIEYKGDLSFTYERLADLQLYFGDLKKALVYYNNGLLIIEELVKQDPSNLKFKRDLSFSYAKIGDLQKHQGNTKNATELYSKSLKIRLEALKTDSTNVEIILEVSHAYSKLNKYQDAANYLELYLKMTGTGLFPTADILDNVEFIEKRISVYTSWSWYLLFTEKPAEVIPVITELLDYLAKDNTNRMVLEGNLAHAYILSGDYKLGKDIYTKFKNQKFPDGRNWNSVSLGDFKALKDEGIHNPGFPLIAKEVFGVDKF